MQPAALVMAAGLFGSTSAFAALDSGKTLLDSCNDPNDTSKQSYCLGYVAGVSDVLLACISFVSGNTLAYARLRI